MTNSEIALSAITGVFVNKDVSAIDKYFDENYIQHNPVFPNGLTILREYVPTIGPDFKYVPGIVTDAGDFVMIHGHYTGWMGGKPMVAVDIFRIINGKIVEHWDVMQEEVTADKSVNDNAMFPII